MVDPALPAGFKRIKLPPQPSWYTWRTSPGFVGMIGVNGNRRLIPHLDDRLDPALDPLDGIPFLEEGV